MHYDLLIVGSGCSGLAAAMYAGRLGLKTLVIGEMRGGTITLTDVIENYPGFTSIGGMELADRLEAHAKSYSNVEIKDGKVERLSKNQDGSFTATCEGADYRSDAVILATGTEWRKLGVPGESEFANKGVHYCALCDGNFYKGKVVGIIGGSDSAAKESVLLSKVAEKVYIIYRGNRIRAEPVNYAAVMNNPKIEIIYNTNVKKIYGNKKVEGVILDNPYNGSENLALDAVFIAIGHVPLSSLAMQVGAKMDDKGYIKINRNSETDIPGLFAAGDVTDTRFKQAIIGVAEGVSAAYSAYLYLESKKSKQ